MPNDATPLIRSFALVGLHGYKNIRLDFREQAKIVIAENGAGKTIFLSALDSFLTRNFLKLSSLKFERVECEIAGQSRPLVIHQKDLPTITDEALTGLREVEHYAEEDATGVRDAILKYDGEDIREAPVFRRVWINSPWSAERTADRISALRVGLSQAYSDEVKNIASTLKAALGTTGVLYLPTYRRVELSISKGENRRLAGQVARTGRPRAVDEPFEEYQSGLGINYGLADVEARLRHLTDFIQRRSNIGYREISAAIIDDLLAGRFASGDWRNEPLPEIDSLRLFFSRIEQSPKDDKQRLEAIAQLYDSGRIDEETNGPLRYFLASGSNLTLGARA
ncbi:MAG: hypothetical protein WA397_04935 [Roseiarcus sp.]